MASKGHDKQSASPSLRTGSRGRRAPIACSPEKLSEFIGDIYDCVLDPAKWEHVLTNLNREFSFCASLLGVVPLRAGAHTINVGVGIDAEWLAVAADDNYRAENVKLWGDPRQVQEFPLDEPIVGSQTSGYAARHTNRYWRDVLEPRGIFDALMVTLAREPQLLGYVALSRHISAGAIGQAAVGTLRLLGPHFRRAVTISNLFDMKAIEAATFSSVLDGIAFGVVLVDSQLGIVHANAVASEMLAARDPIESQKGVLTTREIAAHEALERAARLASEDAAAMGARGIGIPVRRAKGHPCVIHVLPLKRGEMRRGLPQRATAALFIAPATTPVQVPSDALALLYDLTPAEKRICELIVEGHPQSAIAATLGIARSTVKTHLLHVFEKTGCKRQVDLVKLAGDLRLPV